MFLSASSAIAANILSGQGISGKLPWAFLVVVALFILRAILSVVARHTNSPEVGRVLHALDGRKIQQSGSSDSRDKH